MTRFEFSLIIPLLKLVPDELRVIKLVRNSIVNSILRLFTHIQILATPPLPLSKAVEHQ
jgi:hypothetical protein